MATYYSTHPANLLANKRAQGAHDLARPGLLHGAVRNTLAWYTVPDALHAAGDIIVMSYLPANAFFVDGYVSWQSAISDTSGTIDVQLGEYTNSGGATIVKTSLRVNLVGTDTNQMYQLLTYDGFGLSTARPTWEVAESSTSNKLPQDAEGVPIQVEVADANLLSGAVIRVMLQYVVS